MFPSKTALILNFTGNIYHWGCFGTAYEIYHTLLDHDYAPNTLSVHDTHGFSPVSKKADNLKSPILMESTLNANPWLRNAMTEADLIVINGEGTLHGMQLHPGPRNLLFFMRMAKDFLKKKTILINHAFFPSNTCEPSFEEDNFYLTGVQGLDDIVPRDPFSLNVYKRLGLNARLGFDCLPRFIKRHHPDLMSKTNFDKPANAPILVSGGATLPLDKAHAIIRAVAKTRRPEQPIHYIMGAKDQHGPEDFHIFEKMKEEYPDLILINAKTFQEWVETIDKGARLISGRFHHSIAANALGVPTVTFPSNVPKIEAFSDCFSLKPPIAYNDVNLEDRIIDQVEQTYKLDENEIIRKRELMLSLAAENFKSI